MTNIHVLRWEMLLQHLCCHLRMVLALPNIKCHKITMTVKNKHFEGKLDKKK